MRVHHCSHSPGHDEDSVALHDDIRQRVRDQEAGGTSFSALSLYTSTKFAPTPPVLENLYFLLPRGYVSTPSERFPCSRDYLESGLNFIFDLAMQ